MTSGQTDPIPTRPSPPTETHAPSTLRVLRSEDLFLGSHEILIDHEGEQYRLRLTRNGKLILQK